MRFVDSHLHSVDVEGGATGHSAVASGTLLLVCGTDKETSEAVLQVAQTNPEWVKAFVGAHPSEAERAGDLAWVRSALRHAAGVGEIGLDPKYSGIGRGSAQMRVFLGQLEVSQSEGKPVQVHSRGAEAECLAILGSFGLKSVLMHWFQGEEALPQVVSRGYFVSFGPTLLYSKKLQRMAAKCNPAAVLTESDSPVVYRPLGNACGPSLVPSVVFKLAELWRTTFEEARSRIAQNATSYLGSVGKG